MSDPLHIPSKGSSRDVARDIMSDNDIYLAIHRLLGAIEQAAQKHGVSQELTSVAVGGESSWADLEAVIQAEIEERFVGVIEKRSSL